MNDSPCFCEDVFAVIVTYNPDLGMLHELVEALLPQVGTAMIVDNGSVVDLTQWCKNSGHDNLILHRLASNMGIAAALNEGFSRSVASGANFVVTFDQDSCPESDHVVSLMNHWFDLSSRSNGIEKIGAIGPSFYDGRSGNFEYPFYRANGFKVVKQYSSNDKNIVKTDALITSGMLVPTAMWCSGLKFNENLFIDFVDTEWCFRSRALGYMHYGCFDVKMRHELSEASPAIFFGLIVLKYSPIRRYYHFRNCLHLIFRSYVPIAFRIRLVGGLFLRFLTVPFIDEKPYSSIKSIAAGIYDVIRGRYGRRVD